MMEEAGSCVGMILHSVLMAQKMIIATLSYSAIRLLFMLQASLLRLLICHFTQVLELLIAYSADAQPRLLQHLHVLQRPITGTHLPQFLESDRHSKLLAKLDMNKTPSRLLLGRLRIVVWRPRSACGSCFCQYLIIYPS